VTCWHAEAAAEFRRAEAAAEFRRAASLTRNIPERTVLLQCAAECNARN
jgi:hypothetical protein